MFTGTTEVYVRPDHLGTNALVGVIEEDCKALILVAVITLVKVRVPRNDSFESARRLRVSRLARVKSRKSVSPPPVHPAVARRRRLHPD